MFSVKLVARPDARMVEVPLEIEAELPREFEGAALLAASGLPRKVKIKAQKDALKLSTAYRADQLVGDIVRSALRGTALDVQRVQEAVTRFVRAVRERRQEGATLLVSSNGRGKIDVAEQGPGARAAVPAVAVEAPRAAAAPDRLAALEKRVGELEAALGRMVAGGEAGDRVAQLEARLSALQAQMARTLSASEVAGPGLDQKPPGAQVISRSGTPTRRPTAVEAYADGLRHELLASAAGAFARSRADTERCDKSAALAAEAELLGAPRDGTAQRLREASAQAAARQSALDRLAQEIEFYAPADLSVAWQLLKRLEDGPRPPDPTPALETLAQAVVRAAAGGDCKPRTAWLRRAAALCVWQLVEPARGEKVDPEWHQAVDSGGDAVVRLACPGIRRADGSGVVRARVQVDPAAAKLPEEPDEPPAVPEPLAPPSSLPPDGDTAPAGDETARAQEAAVAAEAEVEASAAEADAEARAEAEKVESAPRPAPAPDPAPAPSAAEKPNESNPLVTPFGDEAAAEVAARTPKIVADDPAHSDEALAAEVALAVETETGADAEWAQIARGPAAFDAQPAGPDEVLEGGQYVVNDDDVEEVHELGQPLPPEPGAEKKSP